MSETRVTPPVGGGADAERRLHTELTTMGRELSGLRARLRLQGILFTLALALVAALAVRPDLLSGVAGLGGPSVITARHFVLVGDDGRPRGDWSVGENGSSRLTLMDHQQRERLNLTLREGGFPGISLTNAAGQQRVALGLLPDETTSLVFADVGGVPRAVLGLTTGDAASLVLADAEGVSRIGLGLDGSGMGSVILPEPVEAGAATVAADR